MLNGGGRRSPQAGSLGNAVTAPSQFENRDSIFANPYRPSADTPSGSKM